MTIKRRRLKKPGPDDPLTMEQFRRIHDMLLPVDLARSELEEAKRKLRFCHERKNARLAYDAFIQAGGVTADEWIDFMNGEPMRGCYRTEGNLRLLINNETRPGKKQKRGNGYDTTL